MGRFGNVGGLTASASIVSVASCERRYCGRWSAGATAVFMHLVALLPARLPPDLTPIYGGLVPYDYDPAYIYLFGGLGIIEGYVPRHTSHPGTPLQLPDRADCLHHASRHARCEHDASDIGASVVAAPFDVTSRRCSRSTSSQSFIGLRVLRAAARIELRARGPVRLPARRHDAAHGPFPPRRLSSLQRSWLRPVADLLHRRCSAEWRLARRSSDRHSSSRWYSRRSPACRCSCRFCSGRAATSSGALC